ncbi:MAG: hypothetical protein KA160_08280, partial [Lacibacter sp.]|nr:hypothetical protein [Lacibacter sp.]
MGFPALIKRFIFFSLELWFGCGAIIRKQFLQQEIAHQPKVRSVFFQPMFGGDHNVMVHPGSIRLAAILGIHNVVRSRVEQI